MCGWQEGIAAALTAQLLSQRLMTKEHDVDIIAELKSQAEYECSSALDLEVEIVPATYMWLNQLYVYYYNVTGYYF